MRKNILAPRQEVKENHNKAMVDNSVRSCVAHSMPHLYVLQKKMIHRLIYNSTDEQIATVEGYKLGNFKLVEFWRSGVADGLNLEELELSLGSGSHADWLPNPISLPIVSEKLKGGDMGSVQDFINVC